MVSEPPSPRRPFQFSLASLLLATVLVSVLAAALGGMLRRRSGHADMPPGFFVLMAAIAPMALMVGISLYRGLVRLIDRRRRR